MAQYYELNSSGNDMKTFKQFYKEAILDSDEPFTTNDDDWGILEIASTSNMYYHADDRWFDCFGDVVTSVTNRAARANDFEPDKLYLAWDRAYSDNMTYARYIKGTKFFRSAQRETFEAIQELYDEGKPTRILYFYSLRTN